jgi:hypothetical protein
VRYGAGYTITDLAVTTVYGMYMHYTYDGVNYIIVVVLVRTVLYPGCVFRKGLTLSSLFIFGVHCVGTNFINPVLLYQLTFHYGVLCNTR